jgi:hypothetical protein
MQGKRTKRKGTLSFVPPWAEYPALLKVVGSLKTLPPWAGSDSSNSFFGNFRGARLRADGEKKKENKPYPYLGGFPRPPLYKRRIIGLIATGKPSGTYTPYIL